MLSFIILTILNITAKCVFDITPKRKRAGPLAPSSGAIPYYRVNVSKGKHPNINCAFKLKVKYSNRDLKSVKNVMLVLSGVFLYAH